MHIVYILHIDVKVICQCWLGCQAQRAQGQAHAGECLPGPYWQIKGFGLWRTGQTRVAKPQGCSVGLASCQRGHDHSVWLSCPYVAKAGDTSKLRTTLYSGIPSTYLVYHLVLRYSIIPPCTAPFEYVLFTQSTYSVRTFYRKYVLGTYFSNTYVLGTYWVQKAWYKYVL